MLEIAHSTEGTAFFLQEPECHDIYVNVTNNARTNVPHDPEDGSLVFSLRKRDGEEINVCQLEGREGLLTWYAENCGYNPDEDNGAEVPIHELIELVGSHMLHDHTQSNSEAADFERRLESWRLLNPPKYTPAAPTPQDLSDSLAKMLAILHPGVVGLIHTHHGEEKCEQAIQTIFEAKALVAAMQR